MSAQGNAEEQTGASNASNTSFGQKPSLKGPLTVDVEVAQRGLAAHVASMARDQGSGASPEPSAEAEFAIHTHSVEFRNFTKEEQAKADALFEYVDPPKYTGKSFGLLGVDNPLRAMCIKINDSQVFENVVVALIGINCLILALTDPLKGDNEGRNKIVSDSEPVFTAFFLVEFAIKVVAMGFVLGDGTYLKDGWNILDFIVVVASVISFGSDAIPGASAIRTIRVLRPLRTVSAVPGMRVLVRTMIGVVPMMANVALVCLFLFFVFGILGMQLFMGTLSKRCHEIEYVPNSTAWASEPKVLDIGDDTRICTNESYHWSGRHCGEGQICLDWRNPDRNVPGNPNMGITSFDNFLWSCLTIFQCITLEGWTPIMYWAMDATSGWAFLYFVLLVFLGGFFVLNLALAVITDTYDGEQATEDESAARAKEEEERLELENQMEEEKKAAAKAAAIAAARGGSPDAKGNPTTPNADGSKGEQAGRKRKNHTALTVPEVDILDDGQPKPFDIGALCKQVIDQPAFERVIVAAIILNTLFLSMEYHGMSKTFRTVLDNMNLVLTILFALEAALKILGLGINEYIKDRFNCFDVVVVIISIVELLASGSGSLGALRAFRILRVMKLVRSWVSLRKFLATMWRAVAELGNFTFIVFLVIFVFSLLGMQMFGGKMGTGDDLPRHNFDSFLWALVTVFQILTGEDWNAVMYDGVAGTSDVSVIYFILLLLIGNFVVVNLFVAILLSEFGTGDKDDDDLDSDDELDEEEEAEMNKYAPQFAHLNMFGRDTTGTTEDMWQEWADMKYTRPGLHRWELLFLAVFDDREGIDAAKVEYAQQTERIQRRETKAMERAKAAVDARENGGNGDTANGLPLSDNPLFESDGTVQPTPPAGDEDKAKPEIGPMEGALGEMRLEDRCPKTFGFLERNNPVRMFCFRLADDKRFEYVVMMMIVVSSIIMATESPRTMENESTVKALEAIDAVFTTIFALEMIIKLAAIGIARHPGSYCADPWNFLDGFIVVLSIVSMPLESLNLGWVRAVRTIRVLRPLRVISRVPELKLVVNALLRSVPGLGNVLFVSLLFWLIFGILAMQLFMGKYHRCDDGTEDNPAIELDQPECEAAGHQWKNADMNFDNIGKAMLTLFEMSTTEGWTAVMYDGVDAVDVGKAPRRNYNEAMALFFLGFMIIGSFFIINLFIGIILDNFSALSREQNESGESGGIFLTKEQKVWVSAHRKLLRVNTVPPPAPPTNPLRMLAYDIASRSEFEFAILMAIVLSTICMAMEHRGMSDSFTTGLLVIDIFFSSIFIAEAVIKIGAYGGAYFSENWNRFDFIVVCGSIFGFISGAGSANFLRVFRLARVFRLVKRLKGLRVLFGTLVTSLPTLGNIGALLLLLCFVYAVLGMNLFGKIKENGELNDHVNFRTFGRSLLVLLRMATGEAWNSIMYSCMITDDCNSDADCGRDPETGEWNCCGNNGAPMYFASYVILGSFLTLNLLIAVVLENFSATKDDEELQVTDEDLTSFKMSWLQLDPDGSGFVQLTDMPKLIKKVPPPLGLGNLSVSRAEIFEFQRALSVPARQHVLYYQEALQAMICRHLKVDINGLPKQVREKVQKQLRIRRLAQQRALITDRTSQYTQADFARLRVPTLSPPPAKPETAGEGDKDALEAEDEMFCINHYFAIMRLQAAVRGFLHRKRMKEAQSHGSVMREVRSANVVAAHVVKLLREASDEAAQAVDELKLETAPEGGQGEAEAEAEAES
ncbi:voltage-dependent calcium channel L type [Pycnococcus provasolii]